MGKKSNIIHAMKKALEKQCKFAENKHDAKSKARQQAYENREPFKQVKGIYSFNTLKSYDKAATQFIKYVLKHHSEVKTLDDCQKYANEYLQDQQDRDLSAWTIHLHGSALASVFDCDKKDFDFDFPQRKRVDITRSRSVKKSHDRACDANFYKIKEFCRATGARRCGLLRKAEQALAALKTEYEGRETSACAEDTLFSDYMQKFLDEKKRKVAVGELELSTWESYYTYCKHIIQYFSEKNLKLSDLKPCHFRDYYQYKRECGSLAKRKPDAQPKGLSVRSVRSHELLIKEALNQALTDGIISTNPAASIKVSTKKNKDFKQEQGFLTIDEAKEFLAFLKGDMLYDIVLIDLLFGVRRSELLGLKWDAIDFKNKKAYIRHTVVKNLTTQHKDRTKTKAGLRKYDLPSDAENAFLRIKKHQQENKKFYGNTYYHSDYVFTHEDGTEIRPNYLTKRFKKKVTEFGRPDLHLHNLRHSCASILYAMGWKPKEMQAWLGHADIQTTLDIYTHVAEKDMSTKAAQLNNLFATPAEC